MKRRIGFVSNSSSSSFCIFGIILDNAEDILKMFPQEEKEPEPGCEHKFDRKNMKFCPECGTEAWQEPDEPDYWEIAEENDYSMYDSEDGLAFGVCIGGYSMTDLKKLEETATLLKKHFKKTARVYSGEYAC